MILASSAAYFWYLPRRRHIFGTCLEDQFPRSEKLPEGNFPRLENSLIIGIAKKECVKSFGNARKDEEIGRLFRWGKIFSSGEETFSRRKSSSGKIFHRKGLSSSGKILRHQDILVLDSCRPFESRFNRDIYYSDNIYCR